MNHETRKLIEAVFKNNELGYLKDDYLVETFRVWDCYRQDWIADSPVLLRFESQDVIVRIGDEGSLEMSVGPVNTLVALEPSDPMFSNRECTCWLRDERCWVYVKALEFMNSDERRRFYAHKAYGIT